MNPTLSTLVANVRWEGTRLRRSRRMWLFAIPPVAGPVGSAIADLYLRIPTTATAEILGLLITGGLAGLVVLDLVALAVGEDLGLRAHLTFFVLPQRRSVLLAGRLLTPLSAGLGGYTIGAALILALGGALVTPGPSRAAIFDPGHLALAIPGFLVFLAGVTTAGATYSRGSAQAIVAGVLAGVVVAGGTGFLLLQGTLTMAFPLVLALAGAGAVGWSLWAYDHIDS